MFVMNVIRFDRPDDGQADSSGVRIIIDGRDLVALTRDAELPFATHEGSPSIAGAYAGLPCRHVAPASGHFLQNHPLICYPFVLREALHATAVASRPKLIQAARASNLQRGCPGRSRRARPTRAGRACGFRYPCAVRSGSRTEEVDGFGRRCPRAGLFQPRSVTLSSGQS